MLRTAMTDERGSVLVFFALALPLLVGVAGFSIDLARVQTLDGEQQRVADAAALAAAKWLDGATPLATARAAGLAVNMAQGARVRTAKDNAGDQVTISFLSSVDPPMATTSVEAARYALAVSTLRHATPWFGAILRAADMPSRKEAVAESRLVACNVTPLMICKPANGPFTAFRGQQFRLTATGQGSQYLPGAFGYLDPPNAGNVGTSEVAEHIAGARPPACYNTSGLSPNTGAMQSLHNAWNTRFDFPGAGSLNGVDAPPAPNFVSHYVRSKGKCDYEVSAAAQSLPRDTNLVGSDTSQVATPGTGEWDAAQRERYFAINHKGETPLKDAFPGKPGGPTRFDLYLRELGISPPGDEYSTPNYLSSDRPKGPVRLAEDPAGPKPKTCYGSVGAVTRRLFYVAVVDCSQAASGSNGLFQSRQYAQFFMTEPMAAPSATDSGTVYGEFVRMVRPGDSSGVLHQIVQLVR
ncbi:MAG: hypothetical protein JWN93_495 [Hyphomicrobiales bacterium]|nr:hypothetical protein [Hyphomicrobiales bacterium]